MTGTVTRPATSRCGPAPGPVVAAALRPSAGPLGGEEFAVLLPSSTLEQAEDGRDQALVADPPPVSGRHDHDLARVARLAAADRPST
jgi:GGDEF domain-containing protein